MEKPGTPESRTRYLFRVLRPLFLWFGLVLILFGIHTHQVWIEKTRIYFDLTMEGKGEGSSLSFLNANETPFGASAALDGRPVLTGQRIPLGQHTFTITHPKAVMFSTNIFIWYGPHNLGTIDLKRARGRLTVSASPPAPLLFIRGPEFGVTLTNSSGINTPAPTDDYIVTAKYAHWQETHTVKVFENAGGDLKIAPRFGILELTASQRDASFQLNLPSGPLVQTGDFPVLIRDLPQETYQLVTWHHNHQWIQKAIVVADMTNSYRFDPQYGTAVLETTPSGATVTSDGNVLGTTPLTLSENQPGTFKFNLQLNNYESASASLEITANQTNSFRTNLISQSYTSSMRAARQAINTGAYDDASRFLADALRAQPNDAPAIALLKQAESLGSIGRASALGKQGDYIAGVKELEKALAAAPDDERAQQMLADFKQHEPQQRARLERENGEMLTNVFNAFTGRITGAAPAETHELTTSKPVHNLQTALDDQFTTIAPILRVTHSGWTNDTFFIDGDQELPGGGRLCMVVGTQIKEGETRILYKTVEFKSEAIGLKILGSFLGAVTKTTYRSDYHPIDPTDAKLSDSDKARIAEGTRLVTERIQHAIDK